MDTAHDNRLFLIICLVLALATVAVYWQVKDHEFVNYDDGKYVTENYRVQAGLTLAGFKWAFTTSHGGYWHPVTWLSHMLDCQLFGLRPAGHHLVSLFFHVANTLLLFFVLHRMTQALWRCAFVAALFALHPLHVESVAWAAERKDVMSAFFWMLAMWAYVRYVERPDIRRYIMVLAFFVLGLMSKPMVVTLPFVLLLMDYWPLGRLQPASPAANAAPKSSQENYERKKRRTAKSSTQDVMLYKHTEMRKQQETIRSLLIEKIPLIAFSAMSSVITFYNQQQEGAMSPLDALPAGVRVNNVLISYVTYLGKMFWPQNLGVIYPRVDVHAGLHILGAFLILASITVLAIRGAKRFPWFAVGWFWFLGTLVPVIGLVQVGSQAMADRYTYIPFVGPFIAIAWGVPELLRKRLFTQKVIAALAGAILIIFSAVTYLQVQYWQNSITLFTHTVNVTTDNSIARVNLGNALADKARFEEAIGHFQEAIRIDPMYSPGYMGMGVSLFRKGRTDEAVALFQDALRIKPNNSAVYAALGDVSLFRGELKDAVAQYQEAIMLGADDAWTHFNLGVALYQMGRTGDAINHFRRAILVKPDYAKAYNSLGSILAGEGKMEEAVGCFREAVRINPNDKDAQDNLRRALSVDDKR